MKDQFKVTRRNLIEEMKTLRSRRNALKGIKGVSDLWDSLTKEMDETQDKIDVLSKALGLPVQERIVTKRDGKFKRKTKPVEKELHSAQKVGRIYRPKVEPEIVLYTGRDIPVDKLNDVRPKVTDGRVHYFDNTGRIGGTLEVKDGKAVPGTSIPGDYITSK